MRAGRYILSVRERFGGAGEGERTFHTAHMWAQEAEMKYKLLEYSQGLD